MPLIGLTLTKTGLRTAIFPIVLLLAPVYCQAGNGPSELYQQGVRLYQQARYTKARTFLEQAVNRAPGVSAYHHLLGRVYGRMAEDAGVFRAVALSRMTLEHLRTAVELDESNVSAIRDLIEYYRRAPAFLGGSHEKAEELTRRLELQEATDFSRQNPPDTGEKPS